MKVVAVLGLGYSAFTFGSLYERAESKLIEEARDMSVSFNHTIEDIEVLSWKPRIFIARKFLTKDEARYVITMGEKTMPEPNENPEHKPGFEGMFKDPEAKKPHIDNMAMLHAFEKRDPKMGKIVDRMHAFARIPRKNGESLALYKTEPGQFWGWSHDSHENAPMGKQQQRMATVIVFLSAPTHGGEIIFPFAAGDVGPAKPAPFDPAVGPTPESSDFQTFCREIDDALRIKPRVGDALMYYSYNTLGKVENSAWHGSCPFQGSTFWVARRYMKAGSFAKFVEKNYNMPYEQYDKMADQAAAAMITANKERNKGAAPAEETAEEAPREPEHIETVEL